MRYATACLFGLLVVTSASEAQAATLPAHDPLSIVVVSDEVNPNNLTPAELTQPGDISAALANAGSGLSIADIDEVPADCVDDAITALQSGSTDVLVYFAHLGARGCDGSDQSAAFTAVVEGFLRDGGGVVVFHHGSYTDPAKQSILQLLGVTANAIEWNVGAGQDVIAVGAGHFVVDNGVTYPSTRNFGADQLGVPTADYGVFSNVPDERYPDLSYLTSPGEERTTLFASDYAGAVALGYDLRRADWAGHVVFYQPGEYQPQALDDLAGPNFQILANAVYYVGTTADEPTDPTDGSDGTDSASVDSSGGGGDASASAGDGPGGTGGNGTGGDGTTLTAETDPTGEDDGGSGCSCRAASYGGRSGPVLWALVALGWARLRSRRR